MTNNTLVSHDRNGCMTKMPKPLDNTSSYTLVYDAWNRLISVSDGDTPVATYMYDARNHRIKKTVGTVATLSYFNQHWREIESIAAGVTTTNVYSIRYIDDIVMRVKIGEMLYAIQDTNWNVCALLSASGVVQERITYDSFGKPTFRNANFTAKTASSHNWTKTFTGQVYDVETGLMLYRNRYYYTGLGRFITRDPIKYNANDVNLYRYVGNGTLNHIDAIGLEYPPVDWNGYTPLPLEWGKPLPELLHDILHGNGIPIGVQASGTARFPGGDLWGNMNIYPGYVWTNAIANIPGGYVFGQAGSNGWNVGSVLGDSDGLVFGHVDSNGWNAGSIWILDGGSVNINANPNGVHIGGTINRDDGHLNISGGIRDDHVYGEVKGKGKMPGEKGTWSIEGKLEDGKCEATAGFQVKF